MRKAILGLVVVLAVAGIAAAVPSGPGGTFYFVATSSNWSASSTSRFAYIDVDSSWNNTSGAVAMGSIVGASTNGDNGTSPGLGAWWNPGTGLRNETAPHSGYVFTTMGYDTTQDPAAIAAGNANNYQGGYTGGRDILSVTANGASPSFSSLNGGWDYNGGAGNVYNPNPNTGLVDHFNAALVVDSGFTPNGETQGFYWLALNGGYVWTQNSGNPGAGFNTGTATTNFGPYSTLGHNAGYAGASYTRLNGTVNLPTAGNGTQVTGVVAFYVSGDWVMTYKKASGGYETVISAVTDGSQGVGGGCALQVGDTNNDGLLDFYYWNGGIMHSEDLDHNGDILGAGETNVGLAVPIGGLYVHDLKLIDLGTKWGNGNDQYALAIWQVNTTGVDAVLRLAFLDSDGNYEDGSLTTIGAVSGASGDQSMLFLTDFYNQVAWVPMAAQQSEVPEPATMMLVGTGVLGLAGVVRRRMIG